jgi:hypothetical protein
VINGGRKTQNPTFPDAVPRLRRYHENLMHSYDYLLTL